MTQRGGKVNCGMGGTEIYVDSRGDVFPCRLITDEAYLAGNIRQGSLSEIFSAPVMVDLRSSAVFAGENLPDCHGCYVRGICAGGCRAFHRARTGDLRRNSREVCRMQRHETIASMWASAGAQRDSVVDNPGSAHCPVVVRTGERHPAFDPTASAVTAAVADAGMRRRNLRVQILGGAR
jgi:radical SAM protein with 4Fe4S-binding SPASM domain